MQRKCYNWNRCIKKILTETDGKVKVNTMKKVHFLNAISNQNNVWKLSSFKLYFAKCSFAMFTSNNQVDRQYL